MVHARAVPESAPETPPVLPEPKLINVEALEGAFSYETGFHRAHWDIIGQWIDANIEPFDRDAAWDEAALLWVTRLRADLGGDYFVLQSSQCVLLCDQKLETARWLLEYTGRAAITVTDYLGETAWSGASGKHVVLVLSDHDDYYQYLSHHSPDGEQAASGGVCIHSGYTHIAFPWRDESHAANTVVHELTHDCVAHLLLPSWLDEGVAMTLQHLIAPLERAIRQSEQSVIYAATIDWRPPMMWDELAERHYAFWTEESIQSFWAGTSFYQPGDPNELSYSLAEVFVKLLSEKGDANAFRAFLKTARQEDAGQTAAMDILGVDLGEVAGTFLGQGTWRPHRKAMIAC